MTIPSERIGLDFQADHVCIAHVRNMSGRPVITDIKSHSHDRNGSGETLSQLVAGVSDSCVISKQIRIPESLIVESERVARFELSLSLLDHPEDYLQVLLPTNSPVRWLGFALRKECAGELNQTIESHGYRHTRPLQFCPRSVALGRAVMTFAIGAGDDYFAAVELGKTEATISFLHQGVIIDVGICSLLTTNWNDPGSIDKAMRDIRTVISLHQHRIFELGLTTPLTRIAMCGAQATEDSRTVLQRYFSGLISILRLNAGYFANPSLASEPGAHRFLVPLGLALE